MRILVWVLEPVILRTTMRRLKSSAF